MSSSTISAGKDILSLCTKCKMVLSHTIVSMVDSAKVGKVKCNTCKCMHLYKDPTKSSAPKKRSKAQSPHKGHDHSNKSSASIWEKAMEQGQAQFRSYSIKMKYTLGEVINHPKFGPGVIDRLLESDKICVIFKTDVKTLIHNKN